MVVLKENVVTSLSSNLRNAPAQLFYHRCELRDKVASYF